MSREFEIRREIEVKATPEQVWDAVTTPEGNASWLFPMGEIEPRLGGAAAGVHTVTAWDPPRHFRVRGERPDGWYNQLEHHIEARPAGTTVIRYVHSGVVEGDWDTQYDSAGAHTDFYLHTLAQYLEHFPGRHAAYVGVEGPADSASPEAFDALRRALRLGAGGAVGDPVTIELDGATIVGEVDYLTPIFVGIRTPDSLLRFFGRGVFGMPVFAGHHLFAEGADAAAAEQEWRAWLTGALAGATA